MKPSTAILMAILAAFVVVPGAFNYAGVCLPQMKIIPESELLEQAAASENNSTMNSFLGSSSGDLKLVPYKDGRDLMQQNPDCCTFKTARDGDASLLPRLFGQRRGFAFIDYQQRYEDNAGKRTTNRVNSIVIFGNCGLKKGD